MIKIALCDDNEVERRLLRKIVTAVLQELHQEVLIVEFSSGEKLQRNFSRGDYDLIFWIVFMKEMDGIATGRAIVKKMSKWRSYWQPEVINICGKAMNCMRLAYLMKPYDVMQVRATICDYFSRNQVSTYDEDMEFLRFSVQQKKFCIKQREISVIESEGRVVYIYHGDEKYRAYQRLNTIEQKLNMKYFLRCTKAILLTWSRSMASLVTIFI